MSGSNIARCLRRRWWLIALLGVLGLLLGGAWVSLKPAYVAGATLVVNPSSDADRQEFIAQPQRFIETQTRVLLSAPVLAQAARALDGSPSATSLRKDVTADGGSTDDTIDLVASAATAADAEQIAHAVADAYVAQSGVSSILEVTTAQRAASPLRVVGGGVAGGLLLGMLLVLLLENVRPVVDGPASIQLPGISVFPVPLSVPSSSSDRSRRGLKRSVEIELRRGTDRLAAWLLRDEPAPHQCVVTSLGKPETPSWVAAELARAMSALGRPASMIGEDAEPMRTGTGDSMFPREGGRRAAHGSPQTWLKIRSIGSIGQPEGLDYLSVVADQFVLLVRNRAYTVAEVDAATKELAGRSGRVAVVVVTD